MWIISRPLCNEVENISHHINFPSQSVEFYSDECVTFNHQKNHIFSEKYQTRKIKIIPDDALSNARVCIFFY